jgi:4-alpha-glucanotransferase
MKYNRSSGIILHPSSLPGPDGIGDFGPEAYHFVDYISSAGFGLWQVLPLGPTGYGDSPYQCFSAFAGNPYLISPVLLMDEGLLTVDDLYDRPKFDEDHVDFGPVINWKIKIVQRAQKRFQKSASKAMRTDYAQFIEQHNYWLDDYVTFMAIKETMNGASWGTWPAPLRDRDIAALSTFKAMHTEIMAGHQFQQFVFTRQWNQLREYAHQNNIQIIGDAPIFVAYDSADAWSKRDLFFLTRTGKPSVVAGVPPDYFSRTGQLWGNPLYRWNVHRKYGYEWWIERIRATLNLFDIIRLDHFRGFAGYWEVPASMPTAEKGRWVKGPGKPFFEAVKKNLGDLPIIAEDLGEITPDVVELRDQFQLPGMKILQFAFSSNAKDPFLPHNFPKNCVAYTGTHDNDTTVSWYQSAPPMEQARCKKYIGTTDDHIAWDMIRTVWRSVAMFAIAPMQDFLSLDTRARMNFPGNPSGNWTWRLPKDALSPALLEEMRDLNITFGRFGKEEI